MHKTLAVPTLAVPDRQAGATLPRDTGEPVFAEPWQAHAFAMVMSLYQDGHYNWAEWDDYLGYHIQAPGHFDEAENGDANGVAASEAKPGVSGANYSRFRAACEKDGDRFYHLWLAATEHLLDAKGMVPKSELEERIAAFAKAEREGPRFAAGRRVLVREIKREGHTHLPLYLRGKTGEVAADRGLFVFPEVVGQGQDHGHDHGDTDTLQHVYCVRFAASEIWGEEAADGHGLNFNLWDYQLQPA